jgi:hypothetical protein
MHTQWFADPVTVDTDGARRRVVRDTLHAAEILLRRWPRIKRGRKHQIAVSACLDAMNGRDSAATARQAFVAAAKQARIFVQGGTPGSIYPAPHV